MAINSKGNNNLAYGLANALQNLSPLPIIAKRAPLSTDIGEFGQNWIYNNQIWMFTSAGTWIQIAAESGSATFSELTVNGSSFFNGAIDADTSNANIILNSGTGNIIISGDSSATTIQIGNGSAAKSVAIGSDMGASSTTIYAGTGGLTLDANGTGNILITPENITGTTYAFTQNVRVGSQSIVVPANLTANATATITMTNSYITSGSTPVIVTVTTYSPAGGYVGIQGIRMSNDTCIIYVINNSGVTISAAINNINVNFMVLE